MEYTKGEWTIHNQDLRAGQELVIHPPVGLGGLYPFYCKIGGVKSQANARLIAAAPLLYEALKGYVELCGNTAYKVDREGLQHYWKLAQQALSKAEKGA